LGGGGEEKQGPRYGAPKPEEKKNPGQVKKSRKNAKSLKRKNPPEGGGKKVWKSKSTGGRLHCPLKKKKVRVRKSSVARVQPHRVERNKKRGGPGGFHGSQEL